MKMVLVLHGERHITRLIQVNLERQGIEVVIASSPTRALELIAKEHPDAILTDVSMRFWDGVDVFRTLKGNQATQDIPIFLVPSPGTRGCGSFGIPRLREWTDPDTDEDDTPQ